MVGQYACSDARFFAGAGLWVPWATDGGCRVVDGGFSGERRRTSTYQPPSLDLAWNLFELMVGGPTHLMTAFAGPGDADDHIQSVAEEVKVENVKTSSGSLTRREISTLRL